MKILPVGAELFHADGETDMRRLIVAFRSFMNTPKTKVLRKDVFLDVAPCGQVELFVAYHRAAYFIMPAMYIVIAIRSRFLVAATVLLLSAGMAPAVS
jgi:hypothetical protein